MNRLFDWKYVFCAALALSLAVGAESQAIQIDLDLFGNGGVGLLPGNEVGTGANAGNSSASGGETGLGFVYDTDTNELDFDFSFTGLTSGLRNAAGGIHLHISDPGADPLNETGSIAVFLNNGSDSDVTLTTPQIAIGATSGNLAGTATLTESEETSLLAGRFYLNIHSEQFPGGELRGNLVPEPASAALLALLAVTGLTQRRRT